MHSKLYYVYIITNQWNSVFYIGITDNLIKRMYQHREKVSEKGFATRYQLGKLVYFEIFQNPLEAIKREKQFKRWRREKKIQLIRINNPDFKDLSDEL